MLPESIGVLFSGLNLVSEIPPTTVATTPSHCSALLPSCPIRRSSPARDVRSGMGRDGGGRNPGPDADIARRAGAAGL